MLGGTVDMDSFPFGMITDKREVMLATSRIIAEDLSLVHSPICMSAGNRRRRNGGAYTAGSLFRDE
jgi:hypothetical protein